MSYLSETDVVHIEQCAQEIRKKVITMLSHAGSGHTAGSLGLADIFASFYFYILKHNPEDPLWNERDRLVLSNGHVVPVQYAAMALSGYFDTDELKTLRALGSRLQGHPERTHLPGIETTSGPLGEGLSQAIGIALGARMDNAEFQTFCVMSDGEQQCGIVWEAVMLAGKEKLNTLTAVIDRNSIQISGATEDVMPVDPLNEKYEAFGWQALLVDGNNVEMFCEAVEQARAEKEKPSVIIAHTVPGKGVPEIEGDYTWHGKVPSEGVAKEWIKKIET